MLKQQKQKQQKQKQQQKKVKALKRKTPTRARPVVAKITQRNISTSRPSVKAQSPFSIAKRTVVHHLNDPENAQSFIAAQGPKLTILKFSAEWCGPCRVMKPKFDEMSKEFPNVTFAGVDADEMNSVDINPAWPEITALPTTLIIKNEKCIDKIVGMNLDAIKNAIAKDSAV
eukprot:UN02390